MHRNVIIQIYFLERLEGVFSVNGNLLTNATPNASARSSLSTRRSASCILQAKKQEHIFSLGKSMTRSMYSNEFLSLYVLLVD